MTPEQRWRRLGVKTVDRIQTDFHAGLAVTRRALFAGLRQTARDFDARAAFLEARQIIGALLEARRHG